MNKIRVILHMFWENGVGSFESKYCKRKEGKIGEITKNRVYILQGNFGITIKHENTEFLNFNFLILYPGKPLK